MQSSEIRETEKRYPPMRSRLFGVWFRHMRVYTKNLVSNGLPPFLEPLIFLAGVGLGLGRFIGEMDGIPYLMYLSTGLLVSTAMYTATFECSFGTFIRLEFDKVYDGMLGIAHDGEQSADRRDILGCDEGIFLFVCRTHYHFPVRDSLIHTGYSHTVCGFPHRSDVRFAFTAGDLIR